MVLLAYAISSTAVALSVLPSRMVLSGAMRGTDPAYGATCLRAVRVRCYQASTKAIWLVNYLPTRAGTDMSVCSHAPRRVGRLYQHRHARTDMIICAYECVHAYAGTNVRISIHVQVQTCQVSYVPTHFWMLMPVLTSAHVAMCLRIPA
eukprot:1538657-Rhodomonas_salina.1